MLIKSFKSLSKKDIAIAGGKGASLGEMAKASLPVPPGFVVLAKGFNEFLNQNHLGGKIEAVLKKIHYKNPASINLASVRIRSLIQKPSMPSNMAAEILKACALLKAKFLAVRSSATAEDSAANSWAGELETYLNVKPNYVINYIIRCWSSLFTPRAIFYRFDKKLDAKKISVAVVIQKMVQSEVSGICFTVHPVTTDKNQMVIEAGFGLGEAVVGGMITPDTYVIDKNRLKVLSINVSRQLVAFVGSPKGNFQKKLALGESKKQKLSGKQIVELAKICKKIERHYKCPQDIEWAYENGKFYVTQSRPITTL